MTPATSALGSPSSALPVDSALRSPHSALNEDVVLSVRNVSKCFEMYEKPVHRLYQTLCAGHRKFYKEFWALKDISFDVHRGECVGIIGCNGAGKSTLLQIITGTLAPTSGEVKVKGRVAALLELGSGFNPEFTGRENVYLNGAILGLSREEIDSRYDDILAFADIGEFINQPVKTYSSGMLVRLAFAVNAFVDPDILIVDEAFAVGDAAFQLKCANRMKALLERKTTVLFVSHDINAVRTYCNPVMWLSNGTLRECGDVKAITERFMADMFGGMDAVEKSEWLQCPLDTLADDGCVCVSDLLNSADACAKRWGSGEVKVDGFCFSAVHKPLEYGQSVSLKVFVRVLKPFVVSQGLSCAFSIRNCNALDIVCCSSRDMQLCLPRSLSAGETYECEFVWRNDLKAGDYALMIAVENRGDPACIYIDYVENAVIFKSIERFPIYALTRPDCVMNVRKLGHADQ